MNRRKGRINESKISEKEKESGEMSMKKKKNTIMT